MTLMEPGSEILKVDEIGRVQTPPEKREALLAEDDRSGMTGAQFARFSFLDDFGCLAEDRESIFIDEDKAFKLTAASTARRLKHLQNQAQSLGMTLVPA